MATGAVTALIVAVLGPLAGLLWARTAPAVTYVIIRGQALPADPEGQGPITIDARFGLICSAAGLVCGGLAYLAGRRFDDVALMVGLALGGTAAAVLAWRTGHNVGLDAFEAAARTARDGATVTGIADVRAKGLLMAWPLFGVAAYGVLELVVRRLPGDRGDAGAGEPDEVAGGELDLKAAPSGGDVDGPER
ncbi:hypothetical protein [Spirillospora albida]|uniref:hypothetical protein n=1 Tax=Spirillospora albida TaxID=58123 RepID=UPI001FDF1FC1|nr:hypothetical protein [Spirillospora albida]